MALVDVLSERGMIRFILFLHEKDRMESEFRTIINSHYRVRDMLMELESLGLIKVVPKHERGIWYSLTDKGARLAGSLAQILKEFE